MFLERFTGSRPAKAAGERLYAATVLQARRPELYADLGAPDTPDGRFEVYTLHVLLVLERLKGEGPKAARVSQAFFDAYLGGLDNGLREMAVGDLAVGKTMRKLGEAFYGRAKAMDVALAALPNRSGFDALVIRTVFADVPNSNAAGLAEYLLAKREALAAAPLDDLIRGQVAWRSAG
jgi:cytochrome b pre-mRNA-processing protein 3